MATRLYLSSDDVCVYTPATKKGACDKTSGSTVCRLARTRTGTGTGQTNTDTNATVNYDVLVTTFVSDPLDSAQTISGTLAAAILAGENNADTDGYLHIHAWVTQGDSDTVRGTLLTDWVSGSELGALSSTANSIGRALSGISLSSVNAHADDRIVVEIGVQCANSFSTSRTLVLQTGSGASPADATGSETEASITTSQPYPWIEFSGTITFKGTYLYTTNTAAPVTPAANRGSWDFDNKIDRYLSQTRSGSKTSQSITETVSTNPYDGIVARFVSDELATQTLAAGSIWLALIMLESNNAADAFQKVHAYVMKPDGTVRATLASNLLNAQELGITLGRVFSVSSAGGSVLNGDRLVVEIGARFTNTVTTSYSAILYVGNTDADAPATAPGSESYKSGWIRFDDKLLFSSGGSNFGGQVVMVG